MSIGDHHNRYCTGYMREGRKLKNNGGQFDFACPPRKYTPFGVRVYVRWACRSQTNPARMFCLTALFQVLPWYVRHTVLGRTAR